MHISQQRTTLIQASRQARIDLDDFIGFLQSSKFQGQGEDWIRTGEVWPILRDVVNKLKDAVDETRR